MCCTAVTHSELRYAGRAELHLAAERVSELLGPKEDDTSGMTATGMLANIQPTTAESTYSVKSKIQFDDAKHTVDSYPLRLTNRNLSGDLQLDEVPVPSTVRKTYNVRFAVNSTTAQSRHL